MKITSVIDTTKSLVTVKIEENDGTEIRKEILFREYQKACMGVEVDASVQRIGQLPKGFVDGGVEGNALEAIIRVPGGKRPFIYYETEYLVPFPDMVFHFIAQRGRPTLTTVHFMDEQGNLYHYPFGNVYSNASICWGQNMLPKIDCLRDFDKLVSLFYSAPTNDDLYSKVEAKIKGEKVSLSQRDLLELVSKKDVFPQELLVPFNQHLKDI